ncbi:transcriptional regulator [Acidaminobacter sp. JC074]|uniref:zinc ribbon domain-containing protein n=1 Tax=Acidaminobacter sp. JC074 TaxID=2530199 RepID=UPI001F0EB9CC|nr:zinc ribbon domain-containing protein [Acidaminobacter sp. JC074]MCH4888046.1 transcriptional regulator [Acidaminobacter sp. JC074]
MKICQSCGMPMNDEAMFGKNADGSKNEEYCLYCYPQGQFNKPDETFEEMVETCVPFMMKEGHTEAEARKYLTDNLKNLKRWQ